MIKIICSHNNERCLPPLVGCGSRFHCTADDLCLDQAKLCDGVADCSDSSDETHQKCEHFSDWVL